MEGLAASSIFRKHVLVAVLLVVTTGASMAIIEQVQVRAVWRSQVAERLSVEAARRQELVLNYLNNQIERASLVASRTQLRSLITEYEGGTLPREAFLRQTGAILVDAVEGARHFEAIWVTNADGIVITATDNQYLDQNISANAAFLQGSRQGYLGDVVLQEGHERAIVSAPARASDGSLVGVVMVLLDAKPLADIVQRRTRLGESGEVLLAVSEQDEIRSLGAPLHSRDILKIPFHEAPQPMQLALHGESGFLESADYRGVNALSAYRPIGFENWGLVAKIDADEAYQPVVAFVRHLLLVDSAIVVLGVVLVFFLVRRMTTPLKQLTAAIETFRKGDLSARVPILSGDEIGVLGESFNRMADALEESHATDSRLAAIVESSSDAIIGKSLDGMITSWNHGAEKLYGYTEEEMIGSSVTTLYPPELADQEKVLMRKIRGGERVEPYETLRVRKDGRPIQVSLAISPIYDASGHIIGASAIARDISELKQMQLEVDQRTRDLETLLYITSHDLREPLRSIRNFAAIVNDRYAPKLDAKGRDFLERVVGAADRMNDLIEDVTTVSRAQRTVQPDELVDADVLIGDALARLDDSIRETNASVQVLHPLPKVRVDRLWATQAIYNLLANALKFTNGAGKPSIEIGAYKANGVEPSREVGLAVRDRGPGVPADQAERIFELFQRAVGRDVEGTGAGLAIVRQIAERHGGRAWVQSRDGGGSEFVITFSR